MASVRNEASDKWLGEGCGDHYERARFVNARARRRDVRCVLALVHAVLGETAIERVLDVPCGSGRLTRELASRAGSYVGADISPSMLAAAAASLREAGPRARALLADGLALPFTAGSFDVVVACRWLHHLHDEASLRAAIGELVRVSRGVVIASFWDECSMPGWRRRLGLKSAEGGFGRSARTREQLVEHFDRAGADVVAWRASLRFVSQQTFVAARVRRARA